MSSLALDQAASVAVETAGTETVRKQIRGSSLLLIGKFISTGLNFAGQLLIVRYLSTSEYGAWAYALSVVAFCQTFAPLGLDEAITRFLPIYHEHKDYRRLFGSMLLSLGVVLAVGFGFVAVFYAVPGQISRFLTKGNGPIGLLLIMMFLVPVQALDNLLLAFFASFSNPRAIFFRKHVLGPGLKLLVVVLLVAFHSKILFLAYGFLAANAAGILIYIWILARQLARQGLFRHFRLKELTVPFREILSFSIPLMSTDLIAVLNQSFGVLLLGYYHNMHAVALFRVVLPVAVLNKLVMTAFTLLYTPSAARLYAKRDYASVNHLYWRTAVWMSVLSFPVFAATFCFARPLTVFLYGPRYSRSGIILALLSLGYYFNVALGFNGLTIRVFGKIRYVVSINLLTAAISVLINLLLIPRYGPVGAAIGTAGTMIVHNILKQAGLRLASGISLFDRKYAGFYLLIGTSAAALTFVGFVLHTNVYLAGTLAAAVSLLVLVLARRELDITDVFPESRKLPLLGRLLASPWPRA